MKLSKCQIIPSVFALFGFVFSFGRKYANYTELGFDKEKDNCFYFLNSL